MDEKYSSLPLNIEYGWVAGSLTLCLVNIHVGPLERPYDVELGSSSLRTKVVQARGLPFKLQGAIKRFPADLQCYSVPFNALCRPCCGWSRSKEFAFNFSPTL